MSTEAQTSIETLTNDLDWSYGVWKDAEGAKNELRDEFFAYADDQLRKQAVQERMISVEPEVQEDEAAVIARIKRFHPGWLVDDYRVISSGGDVHFEVILIEDVSLKPFSYVNKESERVFGRSIRSGSVMLDDDYMQMADPILYEEITFKLPWGERVTPPLDTLSSDQLSRVQNFIYKGQPKAALAAPRDAKPEELE